MTSSSDRNQYGEPTVVGASGRDGVDVGEFRERELLDQLSLVVRPRRWPIVLPRRGPGTRRPPPRSVAADHQLVAGDVDADVGQSEVAAAVDNNLDDLARRVTRVVADFVDEGSRAVLSRRLVRFREVVQQRHLHLLPQTSQR